MTLAIVERAGATDVGRQRSTNEDSYLESPPLFAVADGMGGARAGEVASRIAVEAFGTELDDRASPEEQLARVARAANSRIHRLAQEDESRAGMGTTLTAVMIADGEVAAGHVGDSRLYRLRGKELDRLTTDHSLVEELVRKGRLSPEGAENHPQRSIITRALGPEPEVQVDTFTCPGRDGDVYLLCSDGLTAMLAEEEVARIVREASSLDEAAHALIDAANESGGRDNITVVLFRLGEQGGADDESDTLSGQETGVNRIDADEVRAALADSERPRAEPGAGPSAAGDPSATMVLDTDAVRRARAERGVGSSTEVRRIRPPEAPPGAVVSRPVLHDGVRRSRRPLAVMLTLVCLAAVGAGLYFASRQFYFLGTDDRGVVTLYRGVPYTLPLDIDLYTHEHASTVPARALPRRQRDAVLDHKLRARGDAVDLIRALERTRGAG